MAPRRHQSSGIPLASYTEDGYLGIKMQMDVQRYEVHLKS